MQKSGRLKNIIDPALILNFLPISDNDDYGDDKDLPVLLAHSVIDDDKDDDKDDDDDDDDDDDKDDDKDDGDDDDDDDDYDIDDDKDLPVLLAHSVIDLPNGRVRLRAWTNHQRANLVKAAKEQFLKCC